MTTNRKKAKINELEKLIEKDWSIPSKPSWRYIWIPRAAAKRDLDDLYAELLILDVTADAGSNATARDEALITLENPSNDELAMLEGIAESLKQYL